MFDLLLLIKYLFCLVDVYFNRQSASLLVSTLLTHETCYAEASKKYTITESEKKNVFQNTSCCQRLETARQQATSHRPPLYHVGNILIVLLLSHGKQICTV